MSERIITMSHQHITNQLHETDGKSGDKQRDTEMINSLIPPLNFCCTILFILIVDQLP